MSGVWNNKGEDGLGVGAGGEESMSVGVLMAIGRMRDWERA